MNEAPRIDIHAHYFPDAYLDLIAEHGAPFGATCRPAERGPVVDAGGSHTGPLARKFTDLELRIAEMDRQGVQVHALSLTQPMVYWAGEDLSRRLAEAFNDAIAGAHEAHPERFVGLATLPWQRTALALAELERVAPVPGIRGVYVATRIGYDELSHERLFPVYERLEDLGLPLFLHPISVVDPQRLARFYLTNLIGNPTESAIAAAHLVFGGVLDRFPRLTVCLPHAGGSFPYLAGRLHHGWQVRPECRHLAQGPLDYLRRFHYDTISHSPQALRYLIDLVGADRVMLGSDYCFDMGYDDPVAVVSGHPGLSGEQQAKILGGNARQLFGL